MVAFAVNKSSLWLLTRHVEPVVEGTIGFDDFLVGGKHYKSFT
jgi:hypothetical protein